MQTLPTFLARAGGSFWMPERASTFAQDVDGAFNFILWLDVFFFILVIGVMCYFAWQYRKRSDEDRTSPIRGNHKLEVLWSLIPGILLVVIFAWGFKGFMHMSVPPADAINIGITGQKWSWTMTYPNGGTDGNHLVVPVDEPVKLTMSSVDVLHSFFVPAFRVKRDVVPNRYTTLWFEATQEGTYPIYCTEYCGDLHSLMIGTVDVVSREAYEQYLSGLQGCADGQSLAECGAVQFQRNGCNACHAVVPDQVIVGPSMHGLFGTERAFADGTSAFADENYIRQSMMEPNSQVVAGYPAAMPVFAGRLDDEQINAIVAYIQSLSE